MSLDGTQNLPTSSSLPPVSVSRITDAPHLETARSAASISGRPHPPIAPIQPHHRCNYNTPNKPQRLAVAGSWILVTRAERRAQTDQRRLREARSQRRRRSRARRSNDRPGSEGERTSQLCAPFTLYLLRPSICSYRPLVTFSCVYCSILRAPPRFGRDDQDTDSGFWTFPIGSEAWRTVGCDCGSRASRIGLGDISWTAHGSDLTGLLKRWGRRRLLHCR